MIKQHFLYRVAQEEKDMLKFRLQKMHVYTNKKC